MEEAHDNQVIITYAYQNNEGHSSTLLSSIQLPRDGTDFKMKINAIQQDGLLELCMEDHIRFLWHERIITPCFADNKTVYFHGHYTSVEDWCKKLYDTIKQYHNPNIHGTISAWWWKHAQDFIKLIARDIGIAMRAVHQAGQYHGNIANGIYIGVEPSKLNDTADPTSMVNGGVVYRNNNAIERVKIETNLKTGYIGNFRRCDETGIDRNQVKDVAAFFRILAYMITYADVREGIRVRYRDGRIYNMTELIVNGIVDGLEYLVRMMNLPSDLISFLRFLQQEERTDYLTVRNVSLPMGWVFGHPYLFNASEALHFVDTLNYFIFHVLEIPARSTVENAYNPFSRVGWTARALNSYLVSQAYNYRRNSVINYSTAVSSIKAFRNTVEHYCDHMPPNRRDKLELVKEIMNDFNILPDIFESMEQLTSTLAWYEYRNQNTATAIVRRCNSTTYHTEPFRMLGWKLR